MGIKQILIQLSARVRKEFGWLPKFLNPIQYPDNTWYRANNERNFDYINFGNGEARRLFDFEIEGIKSWNLALRDQTLAWDFKELKHWFSILKPGGLAIFPIFPDTCLNAHKDIADKRPYYYHFQQINYLSDNRFEQFWIKLQRNFPFLMARFKDYVNRKRYTPEEFACIDTDRHKPLRQETASEVTLNLVREIGKFCREREITPLFLLIADENYVMDETIRSVFSVNGSETFARTNKDNLQTFTNQKIATI